MHFTDGMAGKISYKDAIVPLDQLKSRAELYDQSHNSVLDIFRSRPVRRRFRGRGFRSRCCLLFRVGRIVGGPILQLAQLFQQ